MLKKLRIKFIIINMTIVSLMLGVIFGLLYYSTSQNLERESLQMMRSIALNPLKISLPNSNKEDVRLPYFTIMINGVGETTEIGGGFFDMSDEDFVQLLLQKTYDSNSSFGVIKDYNLRFIRNKTPKGECIVYADITSEQSTLNNLVKNFALIGLAAFCAFFGISILLARWAVKPVENAWKQQKQFVGDASHELKTPLTVIMTDAELLQSSDCSPEETAKLSHSIFTMATEMRNLVERMLDLARIEGKSLAEKHVAVSLTELASDSAMIFEPVFFEKNLSFQYDIEENIMVNGNSSQLKQLVDIFLDNAGKYASPNGKVFLSLKSIGHKHCLLSLSNQGEPLSDEEILQIFKRFYRADKARSLNHSYGLGLSIAQSIVQEHKGKIWAESSKGYNSFFVELPCI